MLQGTKIYEMGMTVRELKELVKDPPEQDESGEDYGVYQESGRYKSSPVFTAVQLNEGDIPLRYLG